MPRHFLTASFFFGPFQRDTFDIQEPDFSLRHFRGTRLLVMDSQSEHEHDSILNIDPRPGHIVLQEKSERAKAMIASFVPRGLAVPVVASPVDRWRQRCRFGVAHEFNSDETEFRYMLTRKACDGSFDTPIYFDDFPIASASVSEAMQILKSTLLKLRSTELDKYTLMLRGLCTIGIHGTKSTQAVVVRGKAKCDVVVSLFYDQPISSQHDSQQWTCAADTLRDLTGFVGIVGRAKGTRLISGRDYVVETLHTATGENLTYRQTEGHFSNPNSHIAELTLDWLCERSKDICDANTDVHDRGNDVGLERVSPQHDLLEMFCGNGNHTIALAKCGVFRYVLGVEINSILVSAWHVQVHEMNKV